MKLNYHVKRKLNCYLKYLEQKKSDYKKIIRTLRIVLDEECSEDALESEISFLRKLTRTSGDCETAEARNLLGLCYFLGLGVTQNLKYAAALYQQAVEQGSVSAQNNLGICYKEGQGVTQDLKRAAELFKQAAAQGLAEAQNNLGTCYKNGQGVTQDLKRAAESFEQAEAQGLAEAQHNLGLCYVEGLGITENLKHAIKLFQQAATQGFARAQNALGRAYSEGIGVKKDLQLAVKYYQQAVDQGLADAQYNLGFSYARGEGVEQDFKCAAELYQKAVDQGSAEAQHNLGYFYKNGLWVQQNLKRAVELYQQSAAQGYAHAQYELGVCYADGKGVVKNLQRVILLIESAAINGDFYAKENLRVLQESAELHHFKLEGIKLEGITVYCTALLGDKDKELALSALSTLAFCYQMGLGTKQDLRKAAKLYTQTVTKGCPGALWDLLLCYRQMPSIEQATVLEFYKRLKTPFSRHLHMECERLSCLAYVYENGAPYFDQDICQAAEGYQKTFECDSKVIEETHSIICDAEKNYAQGKKTQYTPLLNLYRAVCAASAPYYSLQGVASSLIAQYAFEEKPKARQNPS